MGTILVCILVCKLMFSYLVCRIIPVCRIMFSYLVCRLIFNYLVCRDKNLETP